SGANCNSHCVPSHNSTLASSTPCRSALPTPMHRVGDVQKTANASSSAVCVVAVHAVPFHCSVSARAPSPSSRPTAKHELMAGHETLDSRPPRGSPLLSTPRSGIASAVHVLPSQNSASVTFTPFPTAMPPPPTAVQALGETHDTLLRNVPCV